MSQTRKIGDDFWASYLAGDYDRLTELMAPDVECRMAGGLVLTGPEQVIPMLQAYATALSELRHDVVHTIEEGDRIAYEVRVSGIHTGPLTTPQGTLPPTGRTVQIESVDVVHVRDGRIASWHTYFDQLSFMSQMRTMPAPAAQG